jgi:toxin ParE1/3/4
VPFRLSARARRDLSEVLKYSLEEHGRDAAGRYELLLAVAIEDVGNQPMILGSRTVRRRPGVRCHAISHSRSRAMREQRAGKPAHQLVYRVADDGIVEILAVTGDSYPATRSR